MVTSTRTFRRDLHPAAHPLAGALGLVPLTYVWGLAQAGVRPAIALCSLTDHNK